MGDRFSPKEDLASLMVKTQQGNAEAYRNLLDNIYPRLTSYVKKRISNNEDAKDVYQTIILKIHKARHTFESKHPFDPWMYSIARNAVIDHFKVSARSKLTYVSDYDEKTLPIESIGVTSPNLRESEVLNSAMAKLTDEQRQAFLLTKFEGMSLEEGAEFAGISLTAFKSRAHRAYKVIKLALMGDDTSDRH